MSGPFLFHVIEGVARIADLGEHAKQYAREHRPDSVGYSWAEGSDFKVFLDAPVVIIISGNTYNSQSIQNRNSAGQNLMLSAHARGLGSCWVGAPMLWLRNPETRKELGIAEAFEPFAAFALGYAASVPPLRSREWPEIVWLDVRHSEINTNESNTKAVNILGGHPAMGLRQWAAYQWLINVRCVHPFNKDRQTCRLGCGQRFALGKLFDLACG